MTARILFLDVDGVLNHIACWKRRPKIDIDPVCVLRLDAVLSATGAAVVLSSSWREMPGLEAKLHAAGVLDRRFPGDWRTVRLNRARGHEIAHWLRRHNVERYAIVDDDADMLPDQQPFFVQTDFHAGGLTDAHAERLIGILGG